jgi:phage shock protein PspC (stress-responsive transcriptional regulator)
MAKKEAKVKEKQKEDDIKKIYRSKEDKMIAGVCGGIAEYLRIDSVWVRLVFFISIFINGIGLLAYLILWVIIPDNPDQEDKENKEDKKSKKVSQEKSQNITEKTNTHDNHSRLIVGSILIFIGVIFMLKEFFKLFDWSIFWAIFFIGIGIILLIRRD